MNVAASISNMGSIGDSVCSLLRTRRVMSTVPDVVKYSKVIHGYAQAGDHANAVRQFEAMEHRGVEPNVVTYNSVINAYAQAGDHANAVRQFESMEQRGIEPSVVTYNSVINAYAQAGDHVNAVRQFESMEQRLSLIHISEPTRPY